MSQKSLGLIETYGLLAGVEAADAAVKSANVKLVGYEMARGSGMTTIKVEGDVGAVKAAISAAEVAVSKIGRVASVKVIPRPSSYLEGMVRNEQTVGYEPEQPSPEPTPPTPSPKPESKDKPAAAAPAKQEQAVATAPVKKEEPSAPAKKEPTPPPAKVEQKKDVPAKDEGAKAPDKQAKGGPAADKNKKKPADGKKDK